MKLEDKPYLKVTDVVDDTTFVVASEGEEVVKNFGNETKTVFELDIGIEGVPFKYVMNKTSRLNWVRMFGNDTKAWVGKKGTARIETIRGHQCIVSMPHEA